MGHDLPLFRRICRRLLVVAIGTATLAIASTGFVAHADNTLTASNPSDGASLPTSPTQLEFTFAQPVGPTKAVITTCNGEPFAVGNAEVAADGVTLTAAVPTPMPKGTCNVVATVSATDSSPNGSVSITFTITADTAVTTAPTDPAPNDTTVAGGTTTSTGDATGDATGDSSATAGSKVGGPLGLSRLLATLALAVLLGSFVLIVTAWPEGVEYILTVRFLRGAWIAALVGTIGTAVFLTAQLTGRSVSGSISPLAWIDLKDSATGLATLARVALTAGCGWVVLRPERALDQASQLPALVGPFAAVATLGLDRTGGDFALLGIAMGILHALAMAIWLGGIVLLTRVVLAGSGEEDLVHAVRGFSRLATPALAVTIVTGIVQTWRLDRGEWFSSSHGRVVILKLLVVIAVAAIAIATRQFVAARLRTADTMTVPLASRLRRATTFEALGGVLIVVLSVWLVSLTPTNLNRVPTIDYAYNDGRFVADNLDLTVRLTGGVGPNGVRVDVTKPETGITSLVLTFLPPAGTTAPGIILTIPPALTGTGAAVLPKSEGVPLSVAGVWTLGVSVTSATGTVAANRTFTVSDD